MGTCLKSIGLFGMNAYLVSVEADSLRALPSFDIVGLPDVSIKESRDRVRFAMKNSGYQFPTAKITVNLAPADVKKNGPIYDVPIFLALLIISGQLDIGDLSSFAFVGELSLNGQIRQVQGILPMTIHAQEQGLQAIFVPIANQQEASVVEGIEVYGVENIAQLISHLLGIQPLFPASYKNDSIGSPSSFALDFADVKGQQSAKRALEIVAAGGHNALMIGSPGSGKSMLAKRLPSILTDMTWAEMIDTTKIHSIAGLTTQQMPLVISRPFRAPHHSISPAGLSGGGSIPKPGEISLAHNGVIFLDELPEFSRASMEILRQPIEDGMITISRVHGTLSYPCSVMLIAAMNPCPCGYFGHPTRQCSCSESQVSRYLAKVSGPLLDRLDLHIDIQPVGFENISSTQKGEPSAEIKQRLDAARQLQNERYRNTGIASNARIPTAHLSTFCPLAPTAKTLLKQAFERLGLSARAYDRILKVSRTIADLAKDEVISSSHVSEAIQYRSLDRKYWQRTSS